MASFSLQGKTALVTGASSGIGQAVAERFRSAGAQVINADRLEPETPDDHFVLTDVSSESDLRKAFAYAIDRFGRLDILVNNAGIQPLGIPFRELTSSILERTFAVNVNGVAYGLKLADEFLEEGGRVINTASFVGMLGVPSGTAYATSKAAVIHLTKCGAIELAPKAITVNAVAPGTIETPAVMDIPDNPEIPFVSERTPLGRLGQSTEVAAAFHFLASAEASYITGAVLPVDGGIAAGWERYDLTAPSEISPDGQWHDPQS